MRFLRWQFMLRQVGLRIPIRPSLSIYLASLIGTATPAYSGELLRGVFIRSRFGTPFSVTAWVLTLERLFDVLVIALLGLVTANNAGNFWVMAIVLLGAVILTFVGSMVAQRLGVPLSVLQNSLSSRNLPRTFLFSLVVWIPTSLLIFIATLGQDAWIAPLDAIHVFSYSTILGGLSLSPAGMGVTGSAMIVNLERFGLFTG